MPLPRTNAKEHPSSSHSDWGGSLKFVVQPVMAKHPDQPDKWTVSGVARSYASKEDADKVRNFLKKNPPPQIKQALDQGNHVDDALPGHLQRLPTWDDVHGIHAKQEHTMPGAIFSDSMLTEALEQAKEALECGCIDKMEDAADSMMFALSEWRRRQQHGVRRFRNIKKTRRVVMQGRGKAKAGKIKKTEKMYRAIRKSPLHNRHR